MTQVLNLPSGVTISGEVVFQCKGAHGTGCSEVVRLTIPDIYKQGHGDELDGIHDLHEESCGRCDDCRAIYLRDMAYEDSLLAL